MLFGWLINEELARAYITTWAIWDGDHNNTCVKSQILFLWRGWCDWIGEYVAEFNSSTKEVMYYERQDLPSYDLSGKHLCILQVDVVYTEGFNRVGFGGIIRSYSCSIVAVLHGFQEQSLNPLYVEALAIFKGLCLEERFV